MPFLKIENLYLFHPFVVFFWDAITLSKPPAGWVLHSFTIKHGGEVEEENQKNMVNLPSGNLTVCY